MAAKKAPVAKKAAVSKRAAGEPKVGAQALDMALRALKDERVRAYLVQAPAVVAGWVAEKKAEHASKPADESGKGMNVTSRFGQKGLEQRAASARRAIDAAFSQPDAVGRAEITKALDSIDTALKVASGLPLVKRKKAHWRVDDMLDQLEAGLIDAVLPRG